MSAALLVLAASGCTALPTVPGGVCGNGVIEPSEDCDTFSPSPGLVCRPKTAAGACHLDCQRRSDGTRPSCPAGWGCDAEDLCRAPTGNFEHAVEFAVGSATSLRTADFDGDGRAEIISAPPEDSFRRMHLSFHYFDDKGVLVETHRFPKLLSSPVFTELSGDNRSDLVFSNFSVGVLLGRDDRGLIPETFHAYAVPGEHIRMLPIHDDVIQGNSPLLALSTIGGVSGLYISDNATGRLRRCGELPGPAEALAGAASGDVIEGETSPCLEAILGLQGSSTFSVFDICELDQKSQTVEWRDHAQESSVALEPAAQIEGTPEVADINGDGHLDVLLGASGRPYVAYGDGHGLATAIPYRPEGVKYLKGSADLPVPLAVGDFTGDGAVDFVFEDGLFVSSPTPDGKGMIYVTDNGNAGARWTVATIADVNGNGKLDVMAASSAAPGIDFFNGTGTSHLIASNLPTSGSVRELAVGDFDGDFTNDLAFIANSASAKEGDSLMIAFGSPGALLTSPVQVARVEGAEQLRAYRQLNIGSLTVSSNQTTSKGDIGALTLLDGSSDRLPFAPYGLATLSSDGDVQSSGALVLSVGAFTAPGQREVIALATADLSQPPDFWLGPTVEDVATTPVRLNGVLDPRLEAWSDEGDGVKIRAACAAADLDGDGRDEALWLMPADNGLHCGLAVTEAAHERGGQLASRETVVLDEPCSTPLLLPVDVDGDGALDVLVLTGAQGDAGSRLLVLWNDGAGGLSSDAVTAVNARGDSPRAFTVLPGTATEPLRLAYVTRDAAMVVDGTRRSRELGAPRAVTIVDDGTGIVAADVNGDGVVDLAVADGGNVSVLLSQLKAQ